MSDSAQVNAGAIVSLTAPDEGDIMWRIEQINMGRNLPPTSDNSRRQPIEWSRGPISFIGYLDFDTLEMALSTSVIGINVGTIYGNIKDQVGLDIDLTAAKGSMKWYLKNGNEIWLSPNISTSSGEIFSNDCKIITL